MIRDDKISIFKKERKKEVKIHKPISTASNAWKIIVQVIEWIDLSAQPNLDSLRINHIILFFDKVTN